MSYGEKPAITQSESPLGLAPKVVQLHLYSAEWPDFYATEIERVSLALADNSVQAAHIGSTAVPSMTAKPIIDILLGYQEMEARDDICERLMMLGYENHGEKGVPGRLFFSFGSPTVYHVHLVEYDGDIWRGHLLFRECLRRNSDVAADYIKLKKDLAQKFPDDRDSYTRGKADFIEKTISGGYASNLTS